MSSLKTSIKSFEKKLGLTKRSRIFCWMNSDGSVKYEDVTYPNKKEFFRTMEARGLSEQTTFTFFRWKTRPLMPE